jgi:hypothetical protein
MNNNFSIIKNNLKKGDIITMGWFGFPVEHYGFYDGNGGIYENRLGHGVKYISVEDFFKRYDYWKIKNIHSANRSDEEINKMIERAKSQLGKKYYIFNYNCEHFIDYVNGNKLYSESLSRLGNLGLGLAIGGLISGVAIYYYVKK